MGNPKYIRNQTRSLNINKLKRRKENIHHL